MKELLSTHQIKTVNTNIVLHNHIYVTTKALEKSVIGETFAVSKCLFKFINKNNRLRN